MVLRGMREMESGEERMEGLGTKREKEGTKWERYGEGRGNSALVVWVDTYGYNA